MDFFCILLLLRCKLSSGPRRRRIASTLRIASPTPASSGTSVPTHSSIHRTSLTYSPPPPCSLSSNGAPTLTSAQNTSAYASVRVRGTIPSARIRASRRGISPAARAVPSSRYGSAERGVVRCEGRAVSHAPCACTGRSTIGGAPGSSCSSSSLSGSAGMRAG
jgi:hypothetical protein